MNKALELSEAFQRLPNHIKKVDPKQLNTAIRKTNSKVFVLDDDPTGTQTVHGIPVITNWEVDLLKSVFNSDYPAIYILTNSRALHTEQAVKLATEIGDNLRVAAGDKNYIIVSRGDSTLRGHYPDEVDALASTMKQSVDATIIAPAFIEGGRFTIDNIHYVLDKHQLIPVSNTEFAKDTTFGYTNSDLRHWVEEKTNGKVDYQSVLSISLADLRLGGTKKVRDYLKSVSGNKVIVLNVVDYRDLEIFVEALIEAERSGKRFICRTAASFAKVRAGIQDRKLLLKEEICSSFEAAGLTVVGSYVLKSTLQLKSALRVKGIKYVEVSIDDLIDPFSRSTEIERCSNLVNRFLEQGSDTILYTQRNKKYAGDLNYGSIISESIVAIISGLKTTPRYLIAKGGITSSDIATNALNVKRALVLGAIMPGVPIWKLDKNSKFPGMPYIVFPGNVGEENSLAEIILALRRDESEFK